MRVRQNLSFVIRPLSAPSPGSLIYRRLNTIFDRTKEHLVTFIEIAFVSILSRRLKRLAIDEVSA